MLPSGALFPYKVSARTAQITRNQKLGNVMKKASIIALFNTKILTPKAVHILSTRPHFLLQKRGKEFGHL